ncbi:hypothetical protein [Phytoactinopolyspora halotolerans]|uniref:Ribosomal protein L7/L12 C-terminal domain-containing protein n=1 Tax=Phytoactinopolyspora halotolerans TaxID=1981512 RepID=A0A6L9SFL9_9ACTN|nr:hypothetical protein [Phytoactinopolyspora halotolerans]NEE04036.1 hypothetical protein [Phytoactinopolyspora halotolerans]
MVELGLILVVSLAIVVSVVIIRRAPERRGKPVENTVLSDVRLNSEFQEELRSLAWQGHTEQAIKLLRKHSKLETHEATLVVQELMVGRVFPQAETSTQTESGGQSSAVIDDHLLRRLNALVEQDPFTRTAAIQLLRDHTGMSVKEAKRFIDAL